MTLLAFFFSLIYLFFFNFYSVFWTSCWFGSQFVKALSIHTQPFMRQLRQKSRALKPTAEISSSTSIMIKIFYFNFLFSFILYSINFFWRQTSTHIWRSINIAYIPIIPNLAYPSALFLLRITNAQRYLLLKVSKFPFSFSPFLFRSFFASLMQ